MKITSFFFSISLNNSQKYHKMHLTLTFIPSVVSQFYVFSNHVLLSSWSRTNFKIWKSGTRLRLLLWYQTACFLCMWCLPWVREYKSLRKKSFCNIPPFLSMLTENQWWKKISFSGNVPRQPNEGRIWRMAKRDPEQGGHFTNVCTHHRHFAFVN